MIISLAFFINKKEREKKDITLRMYNIQQIYDHE